MPIDEKILRTRQAEAGKIKIGELGAPRDKKSGRGTYQLPEKRFDFLVTTNERDPKTGNFFVDSALMSTLTKDKDGKITEIPILLDSDIVEEVFPHALACYHGRNLYCRGDGKTATRYEIKRETRDGETVTIKTGNSKTVECPCNLLGAEEGLVCKPHGTLWCTIAAGEMTRIGARHSFRTTSWNSVAFLKAGLERIQRIVGTLCGVPLWLCVRPHLVRHKGSSGQRRVPLVHVECRTHDLVDLQRGAIERAKGRQIVFELAHRPLALGLPGPGQNESSLDQAQLQQEFHPDADVPSEEAEMPDHDPDTGEVFGDDALPPPEDEDQRPPEEQDDPDALLPEGHPIRVAFQKLITDVFIDRDFADSEAKSGRAEIWEEACEKAEIPKLGWKDLTSSRASRIGPVLLSMLRDPEAV